MPWLPTPASSRARRDARTSTGTTKTGASSRGHLTRGIARRWGGPRWRTATGRRRGGWLSPATSQACYGAPIPMRSSPTAEEGLRAPRQPVFLVLLVSVGLGSELSFGSNGGGGVRALGHGESSGERRGTPNRPGGRIYRARNKSCQRNLMDRRRGAWVVLECPIECDLNAV